MAGNNTDPAWILVLLLAIFGVIGGLVWFFFHTELLEFMRYVRMVELAPLSLVDKQASACFDWTRLAPSGRIVPTNNLLYAATGCFGYENLRRLPVDKAMDFYSLSASSIGALGRFTGYYYRWVLGIVCVYFAYHMIFVSFRNKYRTRYNLESFIRVQAKIWPVIAPFVKFDPAKHSARILGSPIPSKLPLFAESLSPEEWISFQRIKVTGGIPDRESVRRAYLKQLGPRWSGYASLPLYMQGLMAAFALKGVQKRDESDDFLGRLALCWSKEKGFVPTREIKVEIQKLLKDPNVGGKALEIANKHAYRTTAILGVLKWARFMGGVLAAAQFLWLRGVDRDLWYAANNLGRRTFHTEGAGAMAHFMAEDAAGKALPIPRLETAIISLNQYLASTQPTIPPNEEPGGARA